MDKTAPLKDFGIDWIGEIPAHWEVKRLKDIGYLYSGLSGKAGDHFNQEDNERSKPFIQFTNIANNLYINSVGFGTVIIHDNEQQNKVRQNDLFFLMSSEGYEDIGKTSLLLTHLAETYLNSFCKGFRTTDRKTSPNYLNYLLNSKAFRNKMIVQGKGFTRINLKTEKVNDFEILYPPLSEQVAIAEYLDEKTATIDAIVTNLNAQLRALAELRKTLINDVVTGRIRVV